MPADRIRYALIVLPALACALLATILGYLAATVPGSWFPAAAERSWGVRDTTVVRGSATVVGDELVITKGDASDVVLLSLNSGFRASDYAAIAWIATGLPDDVDVQLLWSNLYLPATLNALRVPVEAGHALPTVVAGNKGWIGQITGIALLIRGSVRQPIRLRGVIAKPMGAAEVLRDRAREWYAFGTWTQASINTLTVGADIQQLPLPVLVASAVGFAGVALLVAGRWSRKVGAVRAPPALIGLFVAAWLVLDVHWTLNLARQVRATADTYAGKNLREKHLAAEDGPLFAFIERARAIMPAATARVFVAADAAYLRGRASYHLYPHNAYADYGAGALPPAGDMRSGDWLLAYRRQGIRYDPAHAELRFDNGPAIKADVKLEEPGAALFLIR